MSITFIGGGNMAGALIGGLVARGHVGGDFRVVEPAAPQRERLAASFPGIGLHALPSAAALAGARLVVLAVKPQKMREAAVALAPHLPAAGRAAPVILSIAAGIRLADVGRWLGGATRLVRAMPNTPALIGKGISGVYAAAGTDAAGRALAAEVLEAGGEVVWVDDEAMLDAVTGVTGSGPAYVFYFLEALEQAAIDLAFEPAVARRLAYATVAGAIELAQRSEHAPATLRAQVTSEGGTTQRALAVMEEGQVKPMIIAAVKAAAERARELGDAFGAQG
jgi:pyrroline-5-carboxylate reductase